MNRLTFEFAPRRQVPWIAAGVFALALGASGLLGLRWTALQQRIERQQAVIADIESARAVQRRKDEAASKIVDPAQALRVAEEQRIAAALAYPWGAVFDALEAADDKEVAVLGFSHDQAGGRSVLTVEALTVPILTAFVERLNRHDGNQHWYIGAYRIQPAGSASGVKAEIFQKQ